MYSFIGATDSAKTPVCQACVDVTALPLPAEVFIEPAESVIEAA